MAEELKTFFPGSKREIRLAAGGIGLLSDKRVNLNLVMSLDDGRILGMPGWLSEEYSIVAKQEGSTNKTENSAQLQGVEVRMFANDTQEEPILVVKSCSLQKFKFVKGKTKKNGALGSIDLHLSLSTISFNAELWKLIPDYNGATFYLQFAGTQMTITFAKPSQTDQEEDDDQGSLLDPVHDAAFGAKQSAELAEKTEKRKRSPAGTESPQT